MAFKEEEVPDIFSGTKGLVGETSEGFWHSLRIGFSQPIHPSYSAIEVGPPSEEFGTETMRGTGLVNARRMVSSFEPFFCGGLGRDCCFEVGWGGSDLGQRLTLGSL